jgi:hypothetical protein
MTPPPALCKNCGKRKYDHKAITLNCPVGSKTKIGYTSYHPDRVYKPGKFIKSD